MPNYLDRLAARTFRPAETVQPRLPFVFEPVTPVAVREETAAVGPRLEGVIERPEQAKGAVEVPQSKLQEYRPTEVPAGVVSVKEKVPAREVEVVRERAVATAASPVVPTIAPRYMPPTLAIQPSRVEAKPASAAPLHRIPMPVSEPASPAPALAPIRIHIGRVEVRAISPSPQPRRAETPARRSSVTPLEDYLKQRKEERG